jgi:hypothetical protein
MAGRKQGIQLLVVFFTTHEPVNASTIGQRTSRSWMGPMVADAHWLAKTDLCTFPGVGQGRSLLITTLAQLGEERNPPLPDPRRRRFEFAERPWHQRVAMDQAANCVLAGAAQMGLITFGAFGT